MSLFILKEYPYISSLMSKIICCLPGKCFSNDEYLLYTSTKKKLQKKFWWRLCRKLVFYIYLLISIRFLNYPKRPLRMHLPADIFKFLNLHVFAIKFLSKRFYLKKEYRYGEILFRIVYFFKKFMFSLSIISLLLINLKTIS